MNLTETAATVVGTSLAVGAAAAALALAFGPVSFDPERSRSGGGRRVLPSAEVARLQANLARLDYYSGPVHGYVNQRTVQAIEYLQRDAGLPQTGHTDDATRNALTTMLAEGNNQINNQMTERMGG